MTYDIHCKAKKPESTETVQGVSEKGKTRVLEVGYIDSQREVVYLWIHPPGSEHGGYSIKVRWADLQRALLTKGFRMTG
jgi:hypothetical protein